MKTRIHIRKDRYKFSAAHMTVFHDGTKEALHGHNYETELVLGTKSLVPFSEFKAVLGQVTSEWDEKVLLAKQNPHFKILKAEKGSFAFSLCKKNYVIPKDEVVLLKTDNITSEALSQLALESFLAKLPAKIKKALEFIELRVDESRGQGATSSWSAK